MEGGREKGAKRASEGETLEKCFVIPGEKQFRHLSTDQLLSVLRRSSLSRSTASALWSEMFGSSVASYSEGIKLDGKQGTMEQLAGSLESPTANRVA